MWQHQICCWLWLVERSSRVWPLEWMRNKNQEKIELGTRRDDVKTAKIFRQPFLGELCERTPPLLRRCEDRIPSKHMQERQQKRERDHIKVCVSVCTLSFFLFSHAGLFLSVSLKLSTHFHTLFLSSRRLLRGVVANKFSEPTWCFVFSSLFLTARLRRDPTDT